MKLILLDPLEVCRIGLWAVLSRHRDDLDIVEDASVADPERVARIAPDLVLADLHVPPSNATAFIARLHELRPDIPVAVMSREAPRAVVQRAVAAGACGFLLKTMSALELVEAVDRLLCGELVVPPPVRAPAVDRAMRGRAPGTIECLSRREREVFDLIVSGWGNKQIAAHLSISIKTVETHRCHINRKLDVRTSADIVRVAAYAGALDGLRPGAVTH